MSRPKKSKGLESLGNLVYSTSPGQMQEHSSSEDPDEVDFAVFDLRVSLDRKNRKGKGVTLITGLDELAEDALKDLAKRLKTAIGTGGSAKDGQVFIQGDHVLKVMDMLRKEGFKVKRSGG